MPSSLPLWKQRYAEVHNSWQDREAPNMVKDHGYLPTKFPKVSTSNGLTMFIVKFLSWSGHRATRINVQGRLIEQPERQPSGISLMTKKYIHSMTARGTADVSSTIIGRSFMWEVKVGRDRPSDAQLHEQAKERKAGGQYEFVHDPDEFLSMYDKFVSSILQQTMSS